MQLHKQGNLEAYSAYTGDHRHKHDGVLRNTCENTLHKLSCNLEKVMQFGSPSLSPSIPGDEIVDTNTT